MSRTVFFLCVVNCILYYSRRERRRLSPRSYSVNIIPTRCSGGSPPSPSHRGCRAVNWSWALTPDDTNNRTRPSRARARNLAPGIGSLSRSPLLFPPSRLFCWHHDGTRTCTFGIFSIMVRFKCTFPRSCSWAFFQVRQDSHSVMDTNEFAVLKLLVLWILGEYDWFVSLSFARPTWTNPPSAAQVDG